MDIQTDEIQAYLRWRILKESAMTKKNYEMLAAVMKAQIVLHKKCVKAIMDSLVIHLKEENPQFDEVRFKEASGFVD
ncbi:MAG: hypothetical protein CMM25_05495 [Rhodospirillaceae bacterium]|nr:hypothetical protein [Rhodospirillaceae bacterium]